MKSIVMKVPVRPTPALQTSNSQFNDKIVTYYYTKPRIKLKITPTTCIQQHSLPAVHHHGSSLLRMVLEDSLSEAEEVSGVRGHSVVRPD